MIYAQREPRTLGLGEEAYQSEDSTLRKGHNTVFKTIRPWTITVMRSYHQHRSHFFSSTILEKTDAHIYNAGA